MSQGCWVLVAFTATATAFSLFQVPYMGLPAELTASYDPRTRLLSLRVLVLSQAFLLIGAGGPALHTLGGENQWLGYLLMSVVAGIVIGASLVASDRDAPGAEPGPRGNGPRSAKASCGAWRCC